jgi:hypothetical protein
MRAVAAPMPLPPPVMSAWRPLNWPNVVPFADQLGARV